MYEVGEGEFGIFAFGDLAPALVVDDPGDDAGIAAVLADEYFKLALEFLLLLGVWEDGFNGAVVECAALRGSERGHVLDQHQAELVAGLVEQGGFYFDLIGWSVDMLTVDNEFQLTCLRSMLKPRSFNILRSYSIASQLGGVYRPSGQYP